MARQPKTGRPAAGREPDPLALHGERRDVEGSGQCLRCCRRRRRARHAMHCHSHGLAFRVLAGEAFMRMFDDYEERPPSPSPSTSSDFAADSSEEEDAATSASEDGAAGAARGGPCTARLGWPPCPHLPPPLPPPPRQRPAAVTPAVDTRAAGVKEADEAPGPSLLEQYLYSGRKGGGGGLLGVDAPAAGHLKRHDPAQARQQRLLEKHMRKQFMSPKVRARASCPAGRGAQLKGSWVPTKPHLGGRAAAAPSTCSCRLVAGLAVSGGSCMQPAGRPGGGGCRQLTAGRCWACRLEMWRATAGRPTPAQQSPTATMAAAAAAC